jgi:hypothetical protein
VCLSVWKYAHGKKGKIISDSIVRGADKSLPRNTSRCILFEGENISFDVGLVIYI